MWSSRANAVFEFRRLARGDYPMLCAWLAQPHIQRWWADDPSPQAVEAEYGACIDGGEPAQVFIARRNRKPLGLAQRFRLADYPAYRDDLVPWIDMPPGACSIDYFIGDEADAGQGWGTQMLRAFTRRLWLDDPSASCLIVPVQAANIASWRTLEKIGFVRAANGLLEPDNPIDTRDHYVYLLARPDAGG